MPASKPRSGLAGQAGLVGLAGLGRAAAKTAAGAPIHLYRWTLKPLIGLECRHLPTCSEYALEAIARNGAWRGGWLALSRLCRCHPWGTHGFDPVPDLGAERHPLAPWRYGRWRGAPGATPEIGAAGADGSSQLAPSCRSRSSAPPAPS